MNRKLLVLIASMLVTFGLGSVHAFSVFIVPLENLLELPRSEISLIYSFTLVAITLAVLLGYRIYQLLNPAWLVLLTCSFATAGLLLASMASSWWELFVGYSLAFGLSNGLGYGFCLQLVGRAMPQRKGFAMGAVTAAYAVGSILFAQLFAWLIDALTLAAALLSVALAVFICGLIAALLLLLSGVRYAESTIVEPAEPGLIDRRKLLQFWLAYLSSVFAGLMAIGHAVGIALSKTGSITLATMAAVAIGIGSALGGFLAGSMVDRLASTRLLIGLPLLSAVALLSISLSGSVLTTVGWLMLVGFSYGSIIAIYPVVISDYFKQQSARAYGQVFTAWGFAGLVAPWSAGLIYDLRADYTPALMIAAVIALMSALFAGFFRLGRAA